MHKHFTRYNTFVQHEHKYSFLSYSKSAEKRACKSGKKMHPKAKTSMASMDREEKELQELMQRVRRKNRQQMVPVVNDLLLEAIGKVINISSLPVNKRVTTDKLYFLPFSTRNLAKLSEQDWDDSSGSDLSSGDDTDIDEAYKDVTELRGVTFSILVCRSLHIFIVCCFSLFCLFYFVFIVLFRKYYLKQLNMMRV